MRFDWHYYRSRRTLLDKSPADAGLHLRRGGVPARTVRGPGLADACGVAANGAIDPHGFVAIDGLEWKACAICGTKPSYYREKWFHGMTERRRLCKRCYGTAVEREQAKVAPLPGTVDLSTMTRLTASVGRCGLYGLAPAGSVTRAINGRCGELWSMVLMS